MRIGLLHSRLSGYLSRCLHELNLRTGAELHGYALPIDKNAPYDRSLFTGLGDIHDRSHVTAADIYKSMAEFNPDLILVSGWADKGYMKVCRAIRSSGVPVIAGCDTQWIGTARQHLASLTSYIHVKRAIDVLWVTGERQAILARALGYSGKYLWDGYYACDWDAFAKSKPLNTKLTEPSENRHPYFLFVGRYVEPKGIDVLVEAYIEYKRKVKTPWRLVCAGTGPLRDMLVKAGAEDKGFVQPSALPALMRSAGAFILPSRFEPWGVVVQEAAASGLPLILSDACGAAVHLLRDHFNGYRFPAGDAHALADRMTLIADADEGLRDVFSKSSFELSKLYTPENWVKVLLRGISELN